MLQGYPSLPGISVTGYFNAAQSVMGPTGQEQLLFGPRRCEQDDWQALAELRRGDVAGQGRSGYLSGQLRKFRVFNVGSETTENALSDFLTGNPNSMEQDVGVTQLTNTWYYAFFMQDNFRVTPRLTLNLGLRYDFQTPPTDNYRNQESTFVPGRQSTVFPTAPAGMLFPGDAGVTRGIVPIRWHHVSPRVGLAMDPFGDGKTSIRAAAGVFYGAVSSNESGTQHRTSRRSPCAGPV